jgi:hypothetical protein
MVTVGPRIGFDPDRYVRLRVRCPEQGKDRVVYLHRLTAYAHGKLDALRFADDPREVHHLDGDKWNNDPDNLQAREPEDHGRLTRELEMVA